jgi:toxin ParE1/3/4
MEFKIIWSAQAIEDLRDLCEFIALDDPRAAIRIGKGILDHVQILAAFPWMGQSYPAGTDGVLRKISYRTLRIFYEIEERKQCLEILHVWHGSRDEPKFTT